MCRFTASLDFTRCPHVFSPPTTSESVVVKVIDSSNVCGIQFSSTVAHVSE